MPHSRSYALILSEAAEQNQELIQAIDVKRSLGYAMECFSLTKLDQAHVFDHDVMVAVGGDGTLNRVVATVLQNDPASQMVAVLPLGTGNDFATACGAPVHDPSAALDWIIASEPQAIDLGMVDHQVFINAVSGGFGAETTSNTSEELKALFGKLAYTITGLGKIFLAEDRHITIEGPESKWQGSLLFLSVANGRLAGGGYHVAPNAILDDGLLDVLVVPDASLQETPSLLIELFTLGRMHTETIQHFRTPWLKLTTPKGIPLTVDGEPYQADTCIIEVEKRKLSFLLPNHTELVSS